MNVIPDGYHTVTPWLITPTSTADLIDFVVGVFDAVELGRMEVDGVIGPKTAHRISAVFHRQWVKREGQRKRKLADRLRRRP